MPHDAPSRLATREELPLLSNRILFSVSADPGRRNVRPGPRFFFASQNLGALLTLNLRVTPYFRQV